MRLNIKIILTLSAFLMVLAALAGCSAANAAGGKSLPAAAPSATPEKAFQVNSLSVNPTEVNAGVPIIITAKVTNSGAAAADYKGNIRMDNTSASSLPSYLPSDEVKIAAGETRLVSTVTTVNNPGTYKVTWDNASQPLVVNPEKTATLENPGNSGPVAAPNFSATDVVTGKPVSLGQYKGTIILLNFVNYGCNPSTNEKVGAQLLAIKKLLSQRNDFMPFSVFCGCCPPEVLRQFAKDNNLNWPWVLDTDYSIAQKYAGYLRSYGYPTLIFIDQNQTIAEFTGYTDLSNLNARIDKLVKGQIK